MASHDTTGDSRKRLAFTGGLHRQPTHGHHKRVAAHMNWNTPMLFGLIRVGYLAPAMQNRMNT